MHLKKIELSGFKSFAKTTVLEFPSKITAIVGPNGSGKSNIAESIRWVMGEQSMKSLRGKKGEDLIWNGSTNSLQAGGVARMGKASVAIIFDNKDGKIPVEFEEVRVGRKIFRDGLNEYYLNDSQVRLKDVVEFVARIGLGETKHNIISQGEVDRILMASSRERREMLEEALGLRVYQLKKNEAERKLNAAGENMKQVEGLLREIAPHLKFLKAQAHKAEMRGSVEEELAEFQKIYFGKEQQEIREGKENIAREAAPLRVRQAEIKKESARLTAQIEDSEKMFSAMSTKTEEEKELIARETRRRELERELGRLEGKLEVEREKAAQPHLRSVDMHYIEEEVRAFMEEVRALMENEDDIEEVRAHLGVLLEDLDKFLNQIRRGTVEQKKDESELAIVRELEKTIAAFQKDAVALAKEIEEGEGVRIREREKYREIQQEIRGLDTALREKQEEERDLALRLERFRFEEERLKMREEAMQRELSSAGIAESAFAGIVPEEFAEMPLEDMKRKIERLRGKLEEIGGIDETVVKEYRETEARHSFLSKELEDLKQASVTLKQLIRELESHMKEDFRQGFSKIKEEFHNYFRIIFGGGKASLQLVEVPVRGETSDEEADTGVFTDEAAGPPESGIEISVDLPRKRIKGLAMLSGGERALTSIALLFAITAVSPPPFLVLDETDAALDEANSQRYGAILRELAKRTQLLLVTHNRETMKVAGVLYGVTMGDDGVSKILSLKLEEAEVYTNR